MARRIYDTTLDRTMGQNEVQMLPTYISSDGLLNATTFANDLMASSEFTSKYGTLSNLQFVERVYQNALGRTASLAELQSLVGQLNAGTITRAGVVSLVSESSEHLVAGNIHAVTNNTELGDPVVLDHTADKAIAGAIVYRLYDAALNRMPTEAEVATQSQKILSGTKTEAQVAADILALPEFTNAYGSLSNTAFVAQIFFNALGRAPTTAESSFWTSALTAGTVSRADLLDGIAQSREHAAVFVPSVGGSLNDTIYSRDGADVIDGGLGADVVDYSLLTGRVFVDLATGIGVQGNGKTDVLYNVEGIIGGAGNDIIKGDAFNNFLAGGAGADVIDGRDGFDTASYFYSTSGVTVSLVSGATNTGGAAQGDVLTSIENLDGSRYNDTLTGDAGDNFIYGRAGADTLDGGAGRDWAAYYHSTAAVNVSLVAGATNTGGEAQGDVLSNIENLDGSAYNDTLTGNAGDNSLSGEAGADTINGGGGSDTASYFYSTAGVTVSLVGGASNTGGDAQGDVLSNIENIEGSDGFNDTLTGDSGNNKLWGRGGADTINGGAGTDTASYLYSTAGVTVSLAAGAANAGGEAQGDVLTNIENLEGSAFNDTLTGNAGNNVLAAGAGDDWLYGQGGADTLDGGDGVDWVSYYYSTGAVNVSLVAGATNSGSDAQGDVLTNIEYLDGSNFNDTLTGNAGDNWISGEGGADTINGGAGIDTASYYYSTAAVNVSLVAGAANTGGHAQGDVLSNIENLYGSSFNDTLTGNSSSNKFWGGAGADTINGGAGIDTASYYYSTAGVVVSLAAGAVNFGGDAEGDVLSNIENLEGSVFNDSLFGNASANALAGGAGDDWLYGEGGADTLDGGDGSDSVSYYYSTGAVNVSLVAGATNTGGDAQGDVLANIENLDGSTFNDTLTGNADDNWIYGEGGADTINGGAGIDTAAYQYSAAGVTVSLVAGAANTGGDAQGDVLTNIENLQGSTFNDTLTGNASDNWFLGGTGADTINGGAGIDTASYYTSTVGVAASLVAGAGNTGGEAQGDVLTNIENLHGTVFNDTLTGNASDNKFWGAWGADTINGGAGNDTASYAYAAGGVSVSLVAGAANSGDEAEGDVLTNVERLEGSAYDDWLTGNTGNNVLDGGAGNDMLIGNGGVDAYRFGRGGGLDQIYNSAVGAGARGELDIGAGVTTGQIWLQQHGDDLLITIMGTQDQAIIVDWYGADASAQLQKVVTSDGLTLDTQLNQLVQAMATYSANSAGFDPTTATQAPSDPTLQSAIAAAWHS